jgi:hypothetical protein
MDRTKTTITVAAAILGMVMVFAIRDGCSRIGDAIKDLPPIRVEIVNQR